MNEEEKNILQSWHTNADAWKTAIASGSIQSRVLVTNEAIIALLESLQVQHIWDLGCGEGWLCRALTEKGIHTFGTDAIEALIVEASALGPQEFAVASYQQIIDKSFTPPRLFDAVVCNFSLFENERVDQLLSALLNYITPQGKLVIQTLHPAFTSATPPYKEGWRKGSWDGFSAEFKDAHPWYFRTIGSWLELLRNNGFNMVHIKEPLHPASLQPASIILVCEKRND